MAATTGNQIGPGSFRVNLAHALGRKGWTHEQLAAEVGRSREAVTAWIGGRADPPLALLPEIARALNIPISELIEGYNDRPGPTPEEVMADRIADRLYKDRHGSQEGPGAWPRVKAIPVVGKVAAGIDTDDDLPPAEAELVLPDRPHLRAVEASGDSLEDVGIFDHDLLLVLPLRYAGQPMEGEIWIAKSPGGVQARIVSITREGEETLVTLKPARKGAKGRRYSGEEVEFKAKVVGVFRRDPERRPIASAEAL